VSGRFCCLVGAQGQVVSNDDGKLWKELKNFAEKISLAQSPFDCKIKYPHCPVSMRVFVVFLTPCLADTKATWLETLLPAPWRYGRIVAAPRESTAN
jgi:hypothetical protein